MTTSYSRVDTFKYLFLWIFCIPLLSRLATRRGNDPQSARIDPMMDKRKDFFLAAAYEIFLHKLTENC